MLSEEIECSVDKSDTVWVIISSILVMIMTPAIGFVYAGLVNKAAIGSMLGLCFGVFSSVSMIWAIIGYSLVYGKSLGGIIGDFTYFMMMGDLNNFNNKCVGQYEQAECSKNHAYWDSCGIPEFFFFFFQNKFASITPALVIGSISERMYMKHSLLFITI
jgi:Amt family ammonium transporter